MKNIKKSWILLLSIVLLIACNKTDTISLSGEWQFKLDKDDVGIQEQWYNDSFKEHIQLPGSLQEQGFGDDIDINTSWTGEVIDKSWYNAPENAKYREKGNIKIPFWLNPEKYYVGAAWYQKEINIPSAWKSKSILLELERTHWETTLYIDGKETGQQNSLSTRHQYALNDLKPGKHKLSIRVDNRVKIPVGINAHSVSDHTQTNWNGIIGKLLLTAKPKMFIEDVQIYPDVATKTAKVNINLQGKLSKSTLNLQLETMEGEAIGKPVRIEMHKGNSKLNAVVCAGKEALLWSEYQPNLYRLRTTLTLPEGKDEKLTQFGFREFKKEETRFTVNGQAVFLRGTLECCIFPLTGYPSMDANYWGKIYRTCKEFGLNHVRFHSWCPPEVAFSEADRIGIYLQVECASWANQGSSIGNATALDPWIYAEGDRILKAYGNHPSFCLMNYGNEPAGSNQEQYLADLVNYWKEKDNRRVYNGAAGWPFLANADYWNTPNPRIQAWGNGLHSIINAQEPKTNYDFAEIIRKEMPTVSHEIGQWCVYPNFKEIAKYTGSLKAKNFEIFKETLEEKQMGDLADAFLYASGKLQTLCYKADIEAALRTPGFAGFQLLDLHDFPGQGSALVGVLDAFWDTKGYVTGAEYSRFCNQTVPLIRFPKMIWKNNEVLTVPVEFAHFGEKPLSGANIIWSITDAENKTLKTGTFTQNLPIGNCIPVGNIEFSFNNIREAVKLTVSVGIENTSVNNQWNIWVYPVEKPEIKELPYLASALDNQTMQHLNDGEKVLLVLPKGSILPEKGGKVAVGFSSIFWNTAWTRKQAPHTLGIYCDATHPALSSFPNDGYSDYQWWDIVSNCDAMIMDDFPADFRPVIHLIDDWFTNRKLGILFEAKVGKGKLMVCSIDLTTNGTERPVASQFRQSMLEYMASDKFDPQQEILPELIQALYTHI